MTKKELRKVWRQLDVISRWLQNEEARMIDEKSLLPNTENSRKYINQEKQNNVVKN